MRIAVLMTGLTAYQDKCFAELAALGNDLLLVHPSSMKYAAFDKSTFTGAVQRHVWDRIDNTDNGESTAGSPPPVRGRWQRTATCPCAVATVVSIVSAMVGPPSFQNLRSTP